MSSISAGGVVRAPHAIPLAPDAHPIPLGDAGTPVRAIALERRGAIPLRGPATAPDAAPEAGPNAPRVRLRHLSHQLEGVFLNQLLQAMRATVPHDANALAGSGEEIFTSMMDERVAMLAADHMTRGVGEALYRELARRLPPEGTTP